MKKIDKDKIIKNVKSKNYTNNTTNLSTNIRGNNLNEFLLKRFENEKEKEYKESLIQMNMQQKEKLEKEKQNVEELRSNFIELVPRVMDKIKIIDNDDTHFSSENIKYNRDYENKTITDFNTGHNSNVINIINSTNSNNRPKTALNNENEDNNRINIQENIDSIDKEYFRKSREGRFLNKFGCSKNHFKKSNNISRNNNKNTTNKSMGKISNNNKQGELFFNQHQNYFVKNKYKQFFI